MLDGVRMNVVETAENGVVNADTIFEFHQDGDLVWASYAGGGILRGSLIGHLDGDRLRFRYAQATTAGELDGGSSDCVVERGPDGRLRLVEHFEWASREGGGTNVFAEL